MKYYDEVCNLYAERMHRKSKAKFRDFLLGASTDSGFKAQVESSIFAKNVVVGDPAKAKYIFTAHYDTPPRLPKFFVKHMLLNSFVTLPLIVLAIGYLLPAGLLKIPFFLNHSSFTAVLQQVLMWTSVGLPVGYLFGFLGGANKHNSNDNSSGVLTLLNIMDKLKDASKEIKDQYCFVFTDNEEKGLLGGLTFAHKHKKELYDQAFINVDCVGLGEQIMGYYASGEPTDIVEYLKGLDNGKFTFKPKKSNLMSMSDHIAFKKYNHVTLLSVDKDNNKSIYGQIHSSNDTKCDEGNIDYVSKTCLDITKGLEDGVEEELEETLDSNLLMERILKARLHKGKNKKKRSTAGRDIRLLSTNDKNSNNDLGID